MKILHVLGFVVCNHTKGRHGIIRNIKQFAILGTTICKFSQSSDTGRKNSDVISIHLLVDQGASIKTTNL